VNNDESSRSQAPDSLQKGLLQLLWTTRPWIRNVVLVIVGLIAFVIAFVPQSVREDVLRKLFHVENEKPPTIARPALDEENAHVSRLKNGHLVRLAGSIVRNDSNVSDNIVQNAVEADAWRYNEYCYNEQFGQLQAGLPAGTVTVEFDVLDQLPQHAKVGASTFESDAFGRCVVKVLSGQTLNAAGQNGAGHVAYAFKFVPN
jgi:hypothetical protein